MSGWLLDTNVLIDLIFGSSNPLEERYAEELKFNAPILLSAISLFEFRFGAEQSRRRDFQLEALRRFLASAAVVEFDDRDAHEAALLKVALASQGTPIGGYDLLIAAQARVRALTVVTANTREFVRVPGILLEDWTQPA